MCGVKGAEKTHNIDVLGSILNWNNHALTLQYANRQIVVSDLDLRYTTFVWTTRTGAIWKIKWQW